MTRDFTPLDKRVCQSEPVFTERLIEQPSGFDVNAFFARMVQLGDVNNAFSRASSYHGDRDRAIELINSKNQLKSPLYMEIEDFYDNELHIKELHKAIKAQNELAIKQAKEQKDAKKEAFKNEIKADLAKVTEPTPVGEHE